MQHLTQSLKTKTGVTGWRLRGATNRCYGSCISYLSMCPEDQPRLNTAIDKLERYADPDRYPPLIKAIVEEFKQEYRRTEAAGREPGAFAATSIGDIVKELTTGGRGK